MGRPERALDPRMGEIAGFATGLHELRYSAGNISYRQMALRTHGRLELACLFAQIAIRGIDFIPEQRTAPLPTPFLTTYGASGTAEGRTLDAHGTARR